MATSRFLATIWVAMFCVSCASAAPAAITARTSRYDPPVQLAEPSLAGTTSLEQTLSDRRSGREFGPAELSLESLGQLFWAGQGITDAAGHRTAPSAGALYPLDLYAVTDSTISHYLPDGHRVEQRADSTAHAHLADAAFAQGFVETSPTVLVIAGTAAQTEAKYGALAQELIDREAGHAAQNILLQATALDLAAVPVGGFDPAAVNDLLVLPPDQAVLYLIPVGVPAP